MSGHPGHCPPARFLVRVQPFERRLRHADQRQVAVVQVDHRPPPPRPLLLRPDPHLSSYALTSFSLERHDGGQLIGSPNASKTSGRSQWTTSTTRPASTRTTASASGA